MNSVSIAMAGPLPRIGSHRSVPKYSTAETIAALAIVLGAGIVLSWWMGRDLNWDFFNYHGYAAHQALGGGSSDFFAAGYQGYLNPAPFLPFAWMQAAGWHSLAIGSVLAALHSLNVLFLYLIAREVSADSERPRSTAAAITLLGAASAPFLCQVGSTFADVTTTVPVMAAVWVTISRVGTGPGLLVAGLGGAAVALKWTNAPYALALLLTQALMLSGADWRGRLARWAALSLAMFSGFVLFYAAWGWRLWQEYGSPVFPLFNRLLRSPDASTESIALDRFVPQSLGELLSLPWRMLALEGWIYTEPPSPDIRPLVLIVLLLLGASFLAWAAVRGGEMPSMHQPKPLGLTIGLPVFFAVSLVGWLATSTNGRYAIPLLLLLGPLIYRAALLLLSDAGARIAVLTLGLMQAAHVANAGNPRWGPQPWTAQWLPAEVPAFVQEVPYLYVLVGRSSESYLASLAHPQSVFTNPIGLISIATDGPGWQRFASLRDQHAGRTKVVIQTRATSDPALVEQVLVVHDQMIDRLGLRLVPGSCREARFNVIPPPDPDGASSRKSAPSRNLQICDAELKPQPDPVLAERREAVSKIMDAFEAACPRFLAPRGVQTEGSMDLWSRLYGRFDLFLMVDWSGGEIFFRQERQATAVRIGNIQTWEEDVRNFRCRRPHDGSRGIATVAGERLGQ